MRNKLARHGFRIFSICSIKQGLSQFSVNSSRARLICMPNALNFLFPVGVLIQINTMLSFVLSCCITVFSGN